MPRLLGKTSKMPVYFGTAFLSVLFAAIALEYLGIVNVVPGFGKEPERIIIVPQEAFDKAPVTR